jgi:hypothetical protein
VAADPWRYIRRQRRTAAGLEAGSGRVRQGVAGAHPQRRLSPDGGIRVPPLSFTGPDSARHRERDEDLPIDGPAGHELFRFSAESGISFQIHHEIEDQYLVPLEKMLTQYPKAKVIWCHLAQMRYQSRNTRYGPDYVRKLIEAHPNLYFDLFSGPRITSTPPAVNTPDGIGIAPPASSSRSGRP